MSNYFRPHVGQVVYRRQDGKRATVISMEYKSYAIACSSTEIGVKYDDSDRIHHEWDTHLSGDRNNPLYHPFSEIFMENSGVIEAKEVEGLVSELREAKKVIDRLLERFN